MNKGCLTNAYENVKDIKDAENERVRKVRRRIEDYLRKAPPYQVYRVAMILSIQTD